MSARAARSRSPSTAPRGPSRRARGPRASSHRCIRPRGPTARPPRASRRAAARAALDVVLPAGERAVLVRVRTDEDAARTADVVRGIALYMGVFALALLVFAYTALTRAMLNEQHNQSPV